ncbi:hypothetical protein DPEC_G00118120 [Dallia pectoralis]|uniref:Uncharacterized protein n=1 Tax=Dallia pectoralis TaxID=75939 RepID=A0ACC2GUN7_DALPE|nr:hypothetical protein DPEC_G00118120 [Dallia pectoralis]
MSTLHKPDNRKSSQVSEDDSGELKRDRPERKSVSFLDSVSVIPTTNTLEVGAHPERSYPSQGLNCLANKHQTQHLDMEGAQEIAYLDEVLEANCCDPGPENTPFNGNTSPVGHPREVEIGGTVPSVNVFNTETQFLLTTQDVIVQRGEQTTFIDQQEVRTTSNGRINGHSGPMREEHENYSKPEGEKTTSPNMTTLKKEARFELRAFQEEKKPSKLFDPCEKEVRVKKIRPSEEVAELERERLELIRGQAVKKNPGMGTRWWNPPQEKSLEEELEPDKLESHRKYEKRKQQRRSEFPGGLPQTYSMTFDPCFDPESNHGDSGELQSTKKDIVVEQIDFAAARKQFLQIEHDRMQAGEKSQVAAPRRGVAPQLYSAKPFSRVSDDVSHVERFFGSPTVDCSSYQGSLLEDSVGTFTTGRTDRTHCHQGEVQLSTNNLGPGESRNSGPMEVWTEDGDGDFTCAHAVMTFVKDEVDSEQHCASSLDSPSVSLSSCYLEECDSGLDELSVRSQDTTILETLSNDFSMDNISDSWASNKTMSAYLGATTPVNDKTEGSTPDSHSGQGLGQGVSEEELEYQAGIMVQNAIQHALRNQSRHGEDWPEIRLNPHSPPLMERHLHLDVLPPSSGKVSTPPPEHQSPTPLDLHPPPLLDLHPPPLLDLHPPPLLDLHPPPLLDLPPPAPELRSPPSPEQSSPPSPLQQSPTPSQSLQSTPPPSPRQQSPKKTQMERPPQRSSSGGPKIIVQSALSRSLALNPDPVPVRTPFYIPPRSAEPPLPSPDTNKDQFSYFSKYSEAAELRSTATTHRAPESEQNAGPFKLRSRKQKTLSMIEEEIRAAQQREEELKKQRQNLGAVRPGSGPRTNQTGRPKKETNSLPARLSLSGNLPPTKLTLTSKTAPGKIEKLRPVPPVSPSSSEGPLPSPLSDLGSDDSGGSGRPKNFMQTLMEDYETHKVKRREKVEDNSVLEATRVTRRKSNMALRWEAGIYANEDEEENEEEE